MITSFGPKNVAIRHATRRPGAAARPAARRRQILGAPPPVSSYAIAVGVTGLFRVADPSVEGFELYIGTDASPDFTASPAATSPTLPIATSPLAPDHEYHLVVRQRDRWNLLSQNTDETLIDVAGDGSRNPMPPSAPFEIAATATADGTVTVTAFYDYLSDEPAAGDSLVADTWAVWLTFDGSAPDPADDPYTETMLKGDGVAKLSYVTDPQTEGTVVKALVRTRRSGTPDVDSTNDTVYSATATLLGPAAVSPSDAFAGGPANGETGSIDRQQQ